MWQSSPTPTTTSPAVAERNPDVLDPATHMELARAAERAGIDYAFFADGYIPHGENSSRIGHAEPHVSAPVFAPLVIAATEHLGVVTTLHTCYLGPAVIARLGGNLDALSGGRWAWNIVPGAKPEEAELVEAEIATDHTTRYAMASEAVAAVKHIWERRGRDVDFAGEYHRVRGTLVGPHPVQEPWPVLMNAGVSETAQELIADTCDYAFTPLPADDAKVRRTVEGIAARTEAKGRNPLEVNLAGAVGVVLAEDGQQARDRLDWVRETLDMGSARDIATELMGGSRTYQENYDGEFDDIARTLGVAHGSRVLAGTPEEIAEQLLDLHRSTGVRGCMFLPCLYEAEQLELIGEVLPYLQKAGVWTPPADRGWSW